MSYPARPEGLVNSIYDCIDKIWNVQYVSKFDLLKFDLTDRAKKISAFVVDDNLYQDKWNEGCLCYISENDVSPSKRSERLWSLHRRRDHLQHNMGGASRDNEEIFLLLEWSNLSVNLHKSEFGQATLKFLGHIVEHGYVRPVIAKVGAIINYPAPTNCKQLMRFLDMVGFYRKFCRNFVEIVSPLTDLLKKNKKIFMEQNLRRALQKNKKHPNKWPGSLISKFWKTIQIESGG